MNSSTITEVRAYASVAAQTYPSQTVPNWDLHPVIQLDDGWWPYRPAGWDIMTAAGRSSILYRAIWEEAIAENLARDEVAAYAENDRRNERPATVDELKEVTAARELGATTEQLARIRAILEERNTALNRASDLQATVNRLQGEDIQGDDPRLIQFWVSAAREATVAGYCPEYDRIAEMVGGPSRDDLREQGHLTNTYKVIVAVTAYHEIEVNAATSGEAVDLAIEEVEENGSENYDRADGYSESVRYYAYEEINN